MSVLRTPEQVALQDVLLACRESAHHLDDAADFAESERVEGVLRELADQRRADIAELEDAIRATDDLPAADDPDRESAAELVHRLRAGLSADNPLADFIRQRADSEAELRQLIEERAGEDLSPPQRQLLADLAGRVAAARRRLEGLLKELKT